MGQLDPYKARPGAGPWHSWSELAMVRSFFYPDRSPWDTPGTRTIQSQPASMGKSVNPFILKSFAEREAEFRTLRLKSNPKTQDADGFSYFTRVDQKSSSNAASPAEQHIPDHPVDCRKKALDIFYRVEAKGSLPHAVVATAQLTAAVLHEERMSQKFKLFDYDYATQFSIEATYASALSKFVTGLVDRDIRLEVREEKAKSKPSSRKRKADDLSGADPLDTDSPSRVSNSMLSNASQIGLPASFVELRHDITHGTMPKVAEMKLMVFRALDWLWDNYWLSIDVGGDQWGNEERERQKYIDETTPEWIRHRNIEDQQ